MKLDYEVIRDRNCELLMTQNSPRCTKCNQLRVTLRGRQYRLKQQTDRCSINSCVRLSFLSREELRKRSNNLQVELKRIRNQQIRLKEKIERSVLNHGVVIDDYHLDNDIKSILENESDKCNSTPFARIFWQQQAEAAKKDPRGMRWHPLMIKWCVYLRYLSSNAYNTLRQSSCITLPSQRTLRDYTYHIRPSSGFSDENDIQLIQIAKLNECEEHEKYVLLLIDEIHVREDLVYDKHSGDLIGLTNMGKLNSQLTSFEKSLSDGPDSDLDKPGCLANSVTTFMVKGLFSRFEFPYASFPCRDVTGDLLFDPLWECISRLERIGMKVSIILHKKNVNNHTYTVHA